MQSLVDYPRFGPGLSALMLFLPDSAGVLLQKEKAKGKEERCRNGQPTMRSHHVTSMYLSKLEATLLISRIFEYVGTCLATWPEL